ncbi:MAG: hypothetical protein KDD69_14035, partial [Bdellovibrionales bacterium]|nr:hypothetical protein [Bdellovibrionales bacterium]
MCGPRSLAFLSYVAVALYPVISKPVLTRLGQLEGTAAVYVVSTVGLLVLLGASSSLRAELRALPRRLCLRTALLLLLALAANSVGAISFYRG